MSNIKVECIYHPGADIVDELDTGDKICCACGLIVGDRIIEMSNEWCYSNAEMIKSNRVGANVEPETSALPIIENHTGKYLIPKLSKADKRAFETYNKAYIMASRINLPDSIIQRTKNILKRLNENKKFFARYADAKVAASLYIVCRQERMPRTIVEICAVSNSSKREVGRYYRQILKVLKTSLQITKATDYLPRFCAQLQLPISAEQLAVQIAEKTVNLEIVSGKTPLTIASAAIYIAVDKTQDRLTYKRIRQVTGVIEQVISACRKDIEAFVKEQKENNKSTNITEPTKLQTEITHQMEIIKYLEAAEQMKIANGN